MCCDDVVHLCDVMRAQASVESDDCISIRYVFSMIDHIFVFQASVFAAQV